MAVFTSQPNSIPIFLLSHLLPEPFYPSQRRRTDHPPQRAIQMEMEGGRS